MKQTGNGAENIAFGVKSDKTSYKTRDFQRNHPLIVVKKEVGEVGEGGAERTLSPGDSTLLYL